MTSLVWCQVLAGNLNPAYLYAGVYAVGRHSGLKSRRLQWLVGFESLCPHHMCVCWNWQTGQLEVLVFRRAGSSPAMHTICRIETRYGQEVHQEWRPCQVGCLFRQLHSISSLGWLPAFHQYINEAGFIWCRSSEEQNASLSHWRSWVQVPSASPEWFPVPHLLLGNNTSNHNSRGVPKA